MAVIVDEMQELIIVPAPDTQVFVRDIWTAVQEKLSLPNGLHIPNFLAIEGDGFVSDDGTQIQRVGLTLTIFQPWLLQFEARAGPTIEPMIVSGGSFIGDSGTPLAPAQDGSNPIAASAFTQVTIAQSPSPTIENLTRVLTTPQFIALKDS